MLFPNDFQRLSTNQIKNKSSLSLIIHILSVKLFVLFCGIIVLMRFLVTGYMFLKIYIFICYNINKLTYVLTDSSAAVQNELQVIPEAAILYFSLMIVTSLIVLPSAINKCNIDDCRCRQTCRRWHSTTTTATVVIGASGIRRREMRIAISRTRSMTPAYQNAEHFSTSSRRSPSSCSFRPSSRSAASATLSTSWFWRARQWSRRQTATSPASPSTTSSTSSSLSRWSWSITTTLVSKHSLPPF